MASKVRLALCKARLIWAFSLDNQKAQIKVLCFRWVGLVRLGPGSDSAGLSSALGFRKTGLVPPFFLFRKRRILVSFESINFLRSTIFKHRLAKLDRFAPMPRKVRGKTNGLGNFFLLWRTAPELRLVHWNYDRAHVCRIDSWAESHQLASPIFSCIGAYRDMGPQ